MRHLFCLLPRPDAKARTTRRLASCAAALGVVAAVVVTAPTVASASTQLPYSDPSAVGSIGLCSPQGVQITSGSIFATPFAWRAVSSVPAKAPYSDDWRTATLFAYQPQNGLLPSEWSGEALTASSRYSNPSNPMAAATRADQSLHEYLEAFPTRWDGLVELRIYLGTADAEAYSYRYPALSIQVTGDTWHAVGGGPVNCQSGTSESIESILLSKSVTDPSSASKASDASNPRTGTTVSTGTPSGPSGRGETSALGAHSTPSGLPLGLLAAIGVALLAAIGALAARRRPSLRAASTASSSTSASKGH